MEEERILWFKQFSFSWKKSSIIILAKKCDFYGRIYETG
jgi:hypothetical protein